MKLFRWGRKRRSNLPKKVFKKIPQLLDGPHFCVLDIVKAKSMAIQTDKGCGIMGLLSEDKAKVVVINYHKPSKRYLVGFTKEEGGLDLAECVWVERQKLYDEVVGNLTLEEALLSSNPTVRTMAKDVQKALV